MELVVRGTRGRRVQIAQARAGQWTARSEDRFLEVFAATCNAKAAYEAAGKSKGSAYTHRRRWPGFDRRWKDAETVGLDQLEEALCERGENLFSSPGLPADVPKPWIPAMTVQDSIRLVKLHQYQVLEIGRKPGRWARRRSLDEARPDILRKFSALAGSMGGSERRPGGRDGNPRCQCSRTRIIDVRVGGRASRERSSGRLGNERRETRL